MRTYPFHYPSGELSGFGVSNTWLQPRAAARLLSANGAEVTFRRRFLRPGNVHVRFQYAGHQFELVEPCGDSSCYETVPADGAQPPMRVIEEVRGFFEQYRPGALGVLGSLFAG